MISPDPVLIEGTYFDPAKHFSDWRERREKWASERAQRVRSAVTRAQDLRNEGENLKTVANQLNTEGLRSATGRLWAPESLRKALKSDTE